jgi:hypothetical protein
MYCFQHFLQVLVSSKKTLYCKELVTFLSCDADMAFEAAKKQATNEIVRGIEMPKKFIPSRGKSKPISEIYTEDGVASLKMEPAIRKMSRELTKLMSKVAPLEEEAAVIGKRISGYYEQIQQGMADLQKVTARISEEYKVASLRFEQEKISQISSLYDSLSSTFGKWKEAMTSETDNFFKNIRIMFAFSAQEQQGLLDVPFYSKLAH